jgi:O-antigen ligase
MNSIVTPNKISSDRTIGQSLLVSARPVLATIVLAVIWISFQPFIGASSGEVESSLVNQYGYTSLCLLSLALLFSATDRRVVVALIAPSWLILMAALLVPAIFNSADSDTVRAIIFALIAMVLAANFITLPHNADELSHVFLWACFLVLGLCYLGLLIFPADAIHQASESESHHAGFWRGLYTHKNIAGPIMAAIAFVGVYLVRRGMRLSGIFIAMAALFFIANTGSKTSLILAPAVMMMVLLPSLMGLRGLAAFFVLAAMLVTHALTIGTVFSPLFDSILRSVDPVTTYTGRIEIWEFAKPYLLESAWTGYGFDGFWRSDLVELGEQPFDRAWDPRGVVHGHNGYLDFALVAGIPMMLVLVWVTVLAPVFDYLRTPRLNENVLLSDLMFMIVAFIVMNAALESFFFRRADPVWLTLIIALFGLRLAARLPVNSR